MMMMMMMMMVTMATTVVWVDDDLFTLLFLVSSIFSLSLISSFPISKEMLEPRSLPPYCLPVSSYVPANLRLASKDTRYIYLPTYKLAQSSSCPSTSPAMPFVSHAMITYVCTYVFVFVSVCANDWMKNHKQEITLLRQFGTRPHDSLARYTRCIVASKKHLP